MSSNNLKITNILAFLLFFYFLAVQQTLVWLVKGLTIFTIILTVLGLFSVFKFIKGKAYFNEIKKHIYVLLLLIVYLVLGYGESTLLTEQIFLYVVALAFLNIGLIFGILNKFTLIKKVFTGIYIISIVNIFPYVMYCIARGRIDKYSVNEFYGGEIYGYITFWPLFLILAMAGFSFTYTEIFGKKTKFFRKSFFAFLFVVFIASIVFSSFTAVLMMMLVIFLVFLTGILSKDKTFKVILLIPFFLILGYFGLYYLSQSEGIVSEDTRLKLTALLELSNSNESAITDEELDEATGFRWQRIEYAIDSFKKEPLVGMGYYQYKNNVKVTSNHSSIFDGFAKFGLLFLFFIALYVSNIYKAIVLFFRTKLKEKKVFIGIILGSSLSFFAISFFNPYLEFATIYIIFFLSGWVRGQLIFYKSNRYESSLD